LVYIDRRLTYIDAQGVAQGVSEADLATWKAPVVILGEPGIGKTELLMKLPERHARFEYVTAKALMRRNIGVEVGRVLVIDGLDELPARQEHDPVQDVLGWLSRFGWPDFFLSCRAADWRTVAKQEIGDDYGVEPIELKLSPLSSDEATEFLSHTHGLDRAEPLIAQLKARGLEEFFGNPLTLQLLDRLASQPEGLPDNRAELFLRASSELRKEQNPKRPRSRLSTISASDALDAAGAACAALILTGAEAIHVGAQGSSIEGDLDLADLAALPRAEAIDTIISSMLFQRRELGDRLAPFHRALAEFLGARWLAAEVKGCSSQRLLALMSYHGGVPASLRGLHAWLAYFSEDLAPEVIAADPYGVLRYGDAAALTPTAARALLRALERLAKAERLMPGARRADIEFALGDFRLPVEAKGQWHRDLWKAASEQLDELYTIEWRAQGRGIYVVFWFGTGVGDQHGLRSPGRGRPKPGSPEELRTALVERLPEHRRGQIAVVVLDVAR
jgi:hypothetical protein